MQHFNVINAFQGYDQETGEPIIEVSQVAFTEQEEADLLDVRKADLKALVKAKGDDILAAGFPHDFGGDYGVQHLQLRDNKDRTDWLTVQAACQAQVAIGNGAVAEVPIRTAENNVIVMTYLDALTMLLTMAGWGQQLYAVSWAKQDAFTAAADDVALGALEAAIDEGWSA